MTKFHKGNLSHGEFFTLQRVTVAVEEARRIDRWSAERAELGNNTTPLVCVPGGPEKQYMWGRMWLPQTPPSKINKTNLSLYFGNFEVSALKGIFYLVTERDAARKQLPGFPKGLLFLFLVLVGLARAFFLTVHASSLFLLSRFATSAFLEGRLLINWKTWYVEEAPATETLRFNRSSVDH